MDSGFPMKSGFKMPKVGLGTWQMTEKSDEEAIRQAIHLGYQHFDTAVAYSSQIPLGNALFRCIQEGIVKREEVFVTTKVWNTSHSRARAKESVELILEQLRTDYLDLVLIHWPTGYDESNPVDSQIWIPKDSHGNVLNSDVDYLETWGALAECVQEGKIRSIGLSNFNKSQMERVLEWSEKQSPPVPVSVLQIEMHPYLAQKKLVEFCQARGIVVMVYASLGSPANILFQDDHPALLKEKVLLESAQRHNKSPAQILLRWAIQRGVAVIPKSSNPTRLAENWNIFDFELAPEEMDAIGGLDRGIRIFRVPFKYLDKHKYYPFHDDF